MMTRHEILYGLDKILEKMEKNSGLLGGKKYGADEITSVRAAKSIIEQIPDNYIDNYQR
jgi:hypothetical protein